MDIKNFKSGSYKKGYEYRYFLPEKINHSFFWTDQVINELLEKASFKLGELNSFSRFVPDTDMFIIMHIFKEAVVSSRIEGTRTNIEEALVEKNEVEPERRDDWEEVNNYVKAMNVAIETLETFDICQNQKRHEAMDQIFSRRDCPNSGKRRRHIKKNHGFKNVH